MSSACQVRDCTVMAFRRCYLPSLPVQSLELCAAHAEAYLADGTLQVEAPSRIRVTARPSPPRFPAPPPPAPLPSARPVVVEVAFLPVPSHPTTEQSSVVAEVPMPAPVGHISCRVSGCLKTTLAARGMCQTHYDKALRWLGRERGGSRTSPAWEDAIAAMGAPPPVPVRRLITRDEAALVETSAARLDLAKALGVEDAPPSLGELVTDIVNELKQTREDRDGAKLERAVAMSALDDIDAALLAGGLPASLTGVLAALERSVLAEVTLLRNILPEGWTLGVYHEGGWEVRSGGQLVSHCAEPVDAVRIAASGTHMIAELDRLKVKLDAINEELASRGYLPGLEGVRVALQSAGADALQAALPNGWQLYNEAGKSWWVGPICATSEDLLGLVQPTASMAVFHWMTEQLAAERRSLPSAGISPSDQSALIMGLLPSGWSVNHLLHPLGCWEIRDECGRPRGEGDSPQAAAVALVAGLVKGRWLPLMVQLSLEELEKLEEIIEEHDGGPVGHLEGWAGRLTRILFRTTQRMRVSLAGRRDLGIIRARRTPAGGLITDDDTLYGPCAIYSAEPLDPAPEPKPGLEVEHRHHRKWVVSSCTDGVLLTDGSWVPWATWTAEVEAVAPSQRARVDWVTPPPTAKGDADIPF